MAGWPPPVAPSGRRGKGIVFDKRAARCNLFAHLSIFENRGPDETYLPTQCTAPQKEAWVSYPDAYPLRTRDLETSSCQRPAAYLRLGAGPTRLFVVVLHSSGPFARGGGFVRAAWSLSWHREAPGHRA